MVKHSTYFIFALCMGLFLVLPPWARAQEDHMVVTPTQESASPTIALSLSPPLVEIVMQPGKTIIQAINIKNEESFDLEITPTLVDFMADSVGRPQLILDKPTTLQTAKLQNLDKALDTPFILKAHSADQLVLRIEMPKTAKDQEYYQTVLLKAKPATPTKTNGSAVQASAFVGVNLLITVSKDGVPHGAIQVESLSVPPILDMFSSFHATVLAKNSGTQFTKAEGEVRITSNLTKQTVKVFPILQENVLAHSARELHAAIKDPDDEKSLIPVPFVYRPLFFFGPYTVTVDVGAPNQTHTTISKTVWALPFSPIVGCIVVFWCIGAIKVIKKRFAPEEKSDEGDEFHD